MIFQSSRYFVATVMMYFEFVGHVTSGRDAAQVAAETLDIRTLGEEPIKSMLHPPKPDVITATVIVSIVKNCEIEVLFHQKS